MQVRPWRTWPISGRPPLTRPNIRSEQIWSACSHFALTPLSNRPKGSCAKRLKRRYTAAWYMAEERTLRLPNRPVCRFMTASLWGRGRIGGGQSLGRTLEVTPAQRARVWRCPRDNCQMNEGSRNVSDEELNRWLAPPVPVAPSTASTSATCDPSQVNANTSKTCEGFEPV